MAPAASAGGGAGGAPTFDSDVLLLEEVLRQKLSPAQREAFRAREFEYARRALRERVFVASTDSCRLLLAQLDGRVKTTTQRRFSNTAGGLFLNGLLAGGDVRGRTADLFCAVRVDDGAIGVAKVYYAPEFGARATADSEWHVSHILNDTSATRSLTRAYVVRYSHRVDLGRGRTALFMPLYVRSLHQVINESLVAAPLPSIFLTRAACDVLRGLALMHAAGWAHCDVKADNIMFDGVGAATLIDLGAATRFGEPTFEGAPEAMALGRDVTVGSALVDLACLASTLWRAAQRFDATSSMSASALAAEAERMSDSEPFLLVIAHILRAQSAAAALEAIGPGSACKVRMALG